MITAYGITPQLERAFPTIMRNICAYRNLARQVQSVARSEGYHGDVLVDTRRMGTEGQEWEIIGLARRIRPLPADEFGRKLVRQYCRNAVLGDPPQW